MPNVSLDYGTLPLSKAWAVGSTSPGQNQSWWWAIRGWGRLIWVTGLILMACRRVQIVEFVTESHRFRQRVQRGGGQERWGVDSAARWTAEAVHKVGATLCVASSTHGLDNDGVALFLLDIPLL